MEKEKTGKFKELAKTFLKYWEDNPDIPFELLRAGYLCVVEHELAKDFPKDILRFLSPPKEPHSGNADYTWDT